MAPMAYFTMVFSYRYVLEAIKQLSAEDRRVQYEEIAKLAGCSTKTVERAVKEFSKTGQVRLLSKGKGFGYKFEVVA